MQCACRFSGLILALAVTIAQAAAAEPQLPSQQLLAKGSMELFDGKTLAGWQPVGDAKWRIVDGTIVTDGNQPGWLMTEGEYADFELSVEFKAPAATNSGVFLRSVLEPTDPTKDCCELNIAPPDNPFPTGSFVGRRRATPRADKLATPNKWHTLLVEFNGRGWEAWLDGQYVLKYPAPESPRRGHIGLQSKEGAVAFRNIRLREIGSK